MTVIFIVEIRVLVATNVGPQDNRLYILIVKISFQIILLKLKIWNNLNNCFKFNSIRIWYNYLNTVNVSNSYHKFVNNYLKQSVNFCKAILAYGFRNYHITDSINKLV